MSDAIERVIAEALASTCIRPLDRCGPYAFVVRQALEPLVVSRADYGQVEDALSAARIALGPDDRPFLDDAIGRLKRQVDALTEERDTWYNGWLIINRAKVADEELLARLFAWFDIRSGNDVEPMKNLLARHLLGDAEQASTAVPDPRESVCGNPSSPGPQGPSSEESS